MSDLSIMSTTNKSEATKIGCLEKRGSKCSNDVGKKCISESLGCSKSIRVFGSQDGSSGGVAVSGDQVVFINFDKDKGVSGSGLSSVGSGPAIDLFVDLGGLELFVRKGKLGNSMDSSCPSIAKQSNKRFFPSRSHRMKTRSGARGFDFKVIEDVLVNKSDGRKEVVKG